MQSSLFLVVIISTQLVYGGLLDQLNTNLLGNINSCATSNRINPFQIAALSTLQSPSDTPTQCFLACVAKQEGIMKMDNTFDKTNIVNTMKPLIDIASFGKNVDATNVINTIADTCSALPANGDECVAAKSGFECFVKTAKMNGL